MTDPITIDPREENLDFESDWSDESSHAIIVINKAEGWTQVWAPGNTFKPPRWLVWCRVGGTGDDTYNLIECRDEWKETDLVRVHGGEKSFTMFKTDGLIDCGLMKILYVGKGSTVRFTAYAEVWSQLYRFKEERPDCYKDPHCSAGVGHGPILLTPDEIPPLNGDPWNDAIGNQFVVAGIDPLGRTNPYAEGIIWGDQVYSYNGHHQLPVVECIAESDYVTVILRTKNKFRSRMCNVWWDDASIEVEPAPIRGQPRVQYNRTYVLLPPDADATWANAVVEGTWDKKRFTIGASADDAGISPLDNKTVIIVNPQEWENQPEP